MIECIRLQKLYSRVVGETFLPEVPSGWEGLMEDFLDELNEAASQYRQGSVKVVQVRPRLGYMRVYIDYKLPEEQMVYLEKIASKYEKLSLNTCSCCGADENIMHRNTERIPTSPICEKCYGDKNGN